MGAESLLPERRALPTLIRPPGAVHVTDISKGSKDLQKTGGGGGGVHLATEVSAIVSLREAAHDGSVGPYGAVLAFSFSFMAAVGGDYADAC